MKKLLLALIFVSYLNIYAQNPIQEFEFNGSLNNTDNTSSFLGTPNFVTDRMGVLRGAQQLTNKAMEAVIDNLPQNNSPRTVSIWVKFDDISTANYIWGYGAAYNAQYFGLLQQATTSSASDLSLASWGAANDVIVSTSLSKNIWYNYNVTFDGKVSKIYRDGVLLKTISGLVRNTKGNIFRLGEIHTSVGINATIDDLKIYNVAMTDEQVLDLYNTTKPVAIVTEVVAETKPVKEITKTKTASSGLLLNKSVNISPKTIEVFSQGNKVLETSQHDLNFDNLPEGTYLLKITNSNSKKVTSN